MLDRAKVRHNILQRVAGSRWGTEINVLRLTCKALVGRSIGYGFPVTGSRAYESDPRGLGTCILNLARPIAGIGSSPRLITPRPMAGTISARNLYIRHCARSLGLILRAPKGSDLRRMDDARSWIFSLEHWAGARLFLILRRRCRNVFIRSVPAVS